MVPRSKIPEVGEQLRQTDSSPPDEASRPSSVHELGKGRRSLRDAVLMLAKKIEEELGMDVSEVTEILGVSSFEPGANVSGVTEMLDVCPCSDTSKPTPPEPLDPDIFDRDTTDLTRRLPKARRDGFDR